MSATPVVDPPGALKSINPELGKLFFQARGLIDNSGPLEPKYRQLIMVAGFAVARIELALRFHSQLALDAGATPEELRQAVALLLFASLPLAPIAEALSWVDDVVAHQDEKH